MNGPPAAARRPGFGLALLGLTLAAAALRLPGICDLALCHWDEGPYVGAPLGLAPYDRGEPLAVYAPPLYPLLNAAAFRLIAPEPAVAILVAALFGILGVPAAGLLARSCFSPGAGVAAAALVAFDPLHVQHSRLALTETTFTFFVLMALLCFATAWRRGAAGAGGRREGVLAALGGAFSGLATLTKYHGFLPLAAAGVVVLAGLFRRRSPGGGGRRLVPFMAAALLFAPGLAIVLVDIERQMGLAAFTASRATWVTGFSPSSLAQFVRATAEVCLRFGSPLLLLAAPAGAVLVLRALLRRRAGAAAALALVAPLLLAALLAGYRPYARLLVPLAAVAAPLAAQFLLAAGRALHPAAPARGAVLVALALLAPGVPALVDALRFRSDSYVRAARLLERELDGTSGPALVVAQQALFPYLRRDAAARAISITEPAAARLLAAREFGLLLSDRRLATHERLQEHLGWLLPALEEVWTLDNPLPGAVLFDRLGAQDFVALRRGAAPRLVDETRLVLFRIRPP